MESDRHHRQIETFQAKSRDCDHYAHDPRYERDDNEDYPEGHMIVIALSLP